MRSVSRLGVFVVSLPMLAAACSAKPPDTVQSIAELTLAPTENMVPIQSAAEDVALQPAPSESPCSETVEAGAREADRPHDSTGAWWVQGGTRAGGSFFVRMSDRNRLEPGSLLVVLHNEGGRSTELLMRAFGADVSFDEEFKGPAWEAATTNQRAAIVRAAVIRNGQKLAGLCGATLTSLEDELATFERAFASFDQRRP